ncbi:MAG: delta-60 repeat domain-containing protein, partial [Chthoniobacterales bacterium]
MISQQWSPGRALLLPDGKFVIYFNSETLTDVRRGAINRYLADGTLDTSFSFTRDYLAVQAAAGLPNGQLIVSAMQREY